MKIDIGSGGYGYSSPAHYLRREADDVEVADETTRSSRIALNAYRSPVSASLANALWTVERERKSGNAEDAGTTSPNSGILERYLEFAVSATDEFH